MTREQSTAKLQVLTGQIQTICPIDGISIGRWQDKTTWRVDYRPQATNEQKMAVQAFLDTLAIDAIDARTGLAIALDTAITAIPPIDPRIKAVFLEWRKEMP